MPWVLSHWLQRGRVFTQVQTKRPSDEKQGWHHAVCYSRNFHGFFYEQKPSHLRSNKIRVYCRLVEIIGHMAQCPPMVVPIAKCWKETMVLFA